MRTTTASLIAVTVTLAMVAAVHAGDIPGTEPLEHGTRGRVEVLRLERSGLLRVADSVADALSDADGEPAALVITQPVTASLRSPFETAAAGGDLASNLVSNGSGAEGDTPTEVVFTPDGTAIVIAHRDSRTLTVIDAATRAVLRSIDVDGSPNAVAITPDGSRVVTANIFEDTASIHDLATGDELAVVPVGDQPGVVRISPDGVSAVVGNTVSGELSVIDIAAGVETDRIGGLAFSSSTSIAFEHGAVVSKFTGFEFAGDHTVLLPERVNGRVQFVDIVAGTVTSLPTAANPVDLDVSPDGTTAVVAHAFATQLVSVIDVASQSVTKTIPTGVDLVLGGIVMNPSKTKAVVGVLNEVRVVDLVGETISPNIFTAGVNDLVVTGDGLHVLVVGFNGALVSFASETVVANLNLAVSTNLGAHSPLDSRGALVGSLFTEELLVVDTNGAAGSLEDRVPTGPPPEGDKARHAAFTPDGATAVAVNILSDNVSIVNVATTNVDAVVPVGDRPSEVAITPDGTTAVVANLDSTFATVVDLVARTTTDIPISTRASQVEISPDGTHAYLAVVSSGDGVWRVNLDTLSVDGPKIATGDMGSIFFLYQQASRMVLSHDGATLVTCNSFTDDLSVIDTATWTEVARVFVGDFPVGAAFSPDDGTIYVTNKNDDTVSVIFNDGAYSFVEATIAVGDQPFELAVAPNGSRLFVANFADATISVVDLPGTAVTGTITLNEPVQDLRVDASSESLYAAGGFWSVSIGPGPLVVLNQAGELSVIDVASGAVVEQVDTGYPPATLALRADGLAMIASPHGDGLVLVGAPGCAGDLDGDGDVDGADLGLLLGAWGTAGPGDLDGSGVVNGADLGLLLGDWGCTG